MFYEPELEWLEETELTETEVDYSEMATDFKRLAGDYIRRYFCDKKLDTGIFVPDHVGDLARYVSLVLNTTMGSGIKKSHELLGPVPQDEQKRVETNGHVSDHTRKIIDILDECAHKQIPKCMAGGMLLIHMELCEGLNAQVFYKVA